MYNLKILEKNIEDEKGNVTVCTVNKAKTNVRSTPTMMKAKNRIIMNLKILLPFCFLLFNTISLIHICLPGESLSERNR